MNKKGYSLVETLISILILSACSMILIKTIQSLLILKVRLKDDLVFYEQLEKNFLLLFSDLKHLKKRGFLVGGENDIKIYDADSSNDSSEIDYFFQNESFIRQTHFHKKILLTHLINVKLRYLTNVFEETWTSTTTLPHAIQIIFFFKNKKTISHFFIL